MSSIVSQEMEDILLSVSSTEEMYDFLINSSKSKDVKTISVCDGKKYLVKIDATKERDENEC